MSSPTIDSCGKIMIQCSTSIVEVCDPLRREEHERMEQTLLHFKTNTAAFLFTVSFGSGLHGSELI